MTEGRILGRDAPPHIPAATLFQLRLVRSGSVLRTQSRVLHAATRCDKDQILLNKIDLFLSGFKLQGEATSKLLTGANVKLHINNLGIVVELYACLLQIGHHGQDHGFVLIVTGKAESLEVG